MRTGGFIVCLAWLCAGLGPAMAGCMPFSHDGNGYTVCRFNPAEQRLELFNLDDTGAPYGNFTRLADALTEDGKKLTFAMNAGMFDDHLKPVGLYIEDGTIKKKLNRRGGYGNFHLKPNGVFLIDEGKAFVMDTDSYAKSDRRPEFATQSGPMLVINGRIHPKFSASGTSLKVRNGVGVTATGEVVFALSESVVSFHQFASLFRDGLKTPNALFFDGTVSSLYAADLNRNDGFLPLGPMVGAYEMR